MKNQLSKRISHRQYHAEITVTLNQLVQRHPHGITQHGVKVQGLNNDYVNEHMVNAEGPKTLEQCVVALEQRFYNWVDQGAHVDNKTGDQTLLESLGFTLKEEKHG